MKTVLTIAGFDPSSGAGITADLMVFAAHGVFGTACITGLTVQSTRGVVTSHPVAPEILSATLKCLQDDLPPDGIKIGMLCTAENVAATAEYLEWLRGTGLTVPVVLDPVLRSSSGSELLHPEGLQLLRERLLPLVDWVTPNLDELSVLSGLPVVDRNDMSVAAQALRLFRSGSDRFNVSGKTIETGVLAKGGHLDPPDDLLLSPDSGALWIPGTAIASTATHGTGCALSSAFLSRLVLGDDPCAAAQAAKTYVAEAIRSATPIGHGRGPLNHLWPLYP